MEEKKGKERRKCTSPSLKFTFSMSGRKSEERKGSESAQVKGGKGKEEGERGISRSRTSAFFEYLDFSFDFSRRRKIARARRWRKGGRKKGERRNFFTRTPVISYNSFTGRGQEEGENGGGGGGGGGGTWGGKKKPY